MALFLYAVVVVVHIYIRTWPLTFWQLTVSQPINSDPQLHSQPPFFALLIQRLPFEARAIFSSSMGRCHTIMINYAHTRCHQLRSLNMSINVKTILPVRHTHALAGREIEMCIIKWLIVMLMRLNSLLSKKWLVNERKQIEESENLSILYSIKIWMGSSFLWLALKYKYRPKSIIIYYDEVGNFTFDTCERERRRRMKMQ